MVRILLNYGTCVPFIGIVTVIYHNLSAVKGRLVNAYVYVDIWTVLKTQFDGRVTFGCKQAVSIVFSLLNGSQ